MPELLTMITRTVKNVGYDLDMSYFGLRSGIPLLTFAPLGHFLMLSDPEVTSLVCWGAVLCTMMWVIMCVASI